MIQFLTEHNIKLWYNPTSANCEYFDDLHKYACDMASSCLLLMVFMHAIKHGDHLCIQACHRIFTLFFYDHDGNASKYSPCIMNQLVDFDASSEKDKQLITLFSSINCYGKTGFGVAADMVCEWAVKNVKKHEKRLKCIKNRRIYF